MQQDIEIAEVRGFTQGTSQGIAIHFRHLDVRDQHVDLLVGALQFQQTINGFARTASGVAINTQVAQGQQRLLQRHLAVVHHQDIGLGQQGGIFVAQ
ncbi:hypothetical protein D3C80_1582860 [compost metagenome]